MKKLILLFLTVSLFYACSAQYNKLECNLYLRGGLTITRLPLGSAAALDHRVDSIKIIAGVLHFYHGVTDLTVTGEMVYPSAGIPLSTGSTWGTSITNNSGNWNTAYGWGNHASAGYLTSETSHATVVVDADFTSQGIMLRGASSGTYSILADASANWNTAYDDRLKWNGGATGIVAATARTSIGATTLGSNIITVPNPSAINFLRSAADNTLVTETAADHRIQLGCTTVGSNLFTLPNPSLETFIKINAANTITTETATQHKASLAISATDVGLGNVDNVSVATAHNNATMTGTFTMPSPFNVGGTSVIASGAELNLTDGGTSNFQVQLNDTTSGNILVPLLSDTIPLFTIGGGNGLRGSQPSFLLNSDLGGFSNTSTKDTIYITSGRFFTKQDSGTVTMGFRFYKHATTWPTSGSTDMMSNVVTLSAATNATTTGTVITAASTPNFSTVALYPGESIAAIVTVKSNGNMPVLMRGTVYGYKRNRKY